MAGAGARVDSRAMDPFAAIMLSGIVIIVVAVWLVGRFYPGSGLEQVGLRTAREIHESREALEAEDLDQMLAAHNARRRARGEAEVSAADLELRVSGELRAQESRRQAYLADRELDQLLEATNRRRRARGLPERTREEARQEFAGGGGANPPGPEDESTGGKPAGA
jgi:hypothetical protein